MMPFINWARSAGGGLVDTDLPAAIGDCALTVARRRKATTVSDGASLGLDIALRIITCPWRSDPLWADDPKLKFFGMYGK
jgi:hypothetical protein